MIDVVRYTAFFIPEQFNVSESLHFELKIVSEKTGFLSRAFGSLIETKPARAFVQSSQLSRGHVFA